MVIHSGHAGGGHYYSYIKVKEGEPGKPFTATWLEYNDSDISKIDAADLEDLCYGGPRRYKNARKSNNSSFAQSSFNDTG